MAYQKARQKRVDKNVLRVSGTSGLNLAYLSIYIDLLKELVVSKPFPKGLT